MSIEEQRDAKRAYDREWYKNNAEKLRIKARLSMRKWRAENPKQARAAMKKWRDKNPNHFRNYSLQKAYGITLEQRNAMFLQQANRCAICKSDSPNGRFWHVDHCHSSNKVRGILCGNCNLMLGHSKDSVENLKAAIRYLSV